MKNLIVYQSVTGNTKSLAMAIEKEGKNLQQECFTCKNLSEITENEVANANCIFVGFWTDKGSCSKEVQQFLSNLKNKKIALFGTAGFGGSPAYFEQILDRVKTTIDSSNEIIGQFMCQGKMPLSVKARYQALLEKNPEDKQAKIFLENFDLAMSHPDKQDLENVKEWVKSLWNH